jgi:hypothetical protein
MAEDVMVRVKTAVEMEREMENEKGELKVAAAGVGYNPTSPTYLAHYVSEKRGSLHK